MFRIEEEILRPSIPSPHARGDVPNAASSSVHVGSFSPRPWGCSVLRHRPARRHALLPTPVGMFRRAGRGRRTWSTSPHARGDVPLFTMHRRSRTRFSPRPWGCSADLVVVELHGQLLPTPVGMFRFRTRYGTRPVPSPHARGDVPVAEDVARRGAAFSPRPWGCSGRNNMDITNTILLPTPVGMFRASSSATTPMCTSPHARGDVPLRDGDVLVRRDFSPRPWGCSVARTRRPSRT